jgi:transaldolase
MSMPKKVEEMNIKIFADGAEKASILELYQKPFIKGFTTNPTLMRKAGVTDYAGFSKDILLSVKDKPISFEVFSDDFSEMERQARIIASWGTNVYVKIPITNTKRESSAPLIKKLAAEGIKLNVTAILTLDQVRVTNEALTPGTPAIVSVFAGRIADTGVDPVPLMKESLQILAANKNYELLWASPRELFNIFQAEEIGCHIITVTPDVLKKTEKIGYDLDELSLDTVKMFYDDGQKVGYTLYE